ncbi:hypothetical protein DFJ58DRAFT_841958 [Suillus subalutaceus]|uniref:uncharacterized protein n=1 Tax=Suillus subalutaceus TaxID=48586 RepID=UPI001B87B32B|nr:uncharacterized protein DFJ58DRAFT_841958 [Suillus subalutaceus]KAG1852095.1 hypothetical protein DFJ58DRAFT_841958 [Suillus subalutaceus]
MSEPIDRCVRFDVPMDTDDESQSSHVGDTPKCLQYPQPTFNFGFNMNTQAEPAQPASAPKSLNFGWMQPAASPDRTAPATTPFNFGMGAPVTLPSTASTPPTPQPKPINFGWDCLPPPASPMQASSTASTPTTPRPQPINFGWDCLPPPGVAYASSAHNSNSRPTDTTPHTIEFWLDWESLIQGSTSARWL